MKTIPIHSLPPCGAAVPALPTPWRWVWLYAAPHRLAFGAGAAMLAASGLWWALAMLARAQGVPLPWALPASLVHGLVMSLGFVPFFFAGFLFTAGPKWLGLPAVEARTLQSPLLAMLAGWLVFGLGVHARDAMLGATFGAAGLTAVALGWSALAWRFVRMLRASDMPDTLHARVIAAAAAVGAVTLWVAAAGVAAGAADVVRAATLVALWGFVGVVYAAVAHRMIPFFTASALPQLDAWRPYGLLWSFVVLLAGEAAFAAAESFWWPLPPALRIAQAAIELPAGAALLALAWRWGLVQSLRVRLLAMLHLGFVWFGVALMLAGVSHALMAASDGALSLGLAPLHAYSMGFLGSTLIAMVSRVSSGHSGRPLAADNFVWRLFWLLQFAVVARVVAAVAAEFAGGAAAPLLAAAALAWGAGCAAWALRYGSWYGRPRIDGRPG